MNEVKGDLFGIDCDAVCISTNGFIKSNRENVMGRGCAKQASEYFPELPKILGRLLKEKGNHVHKLLEYEGVEMLSFPVKTDINSCLKSTSDVVKHMRKHYEVGSQVPGWACVADIRIIKKSARQLVEYVNGTDWKKVLIPFVGCGYGELRWEDVKPVLEDILDDRFYAVTFK